MTTDLETEHGALLTEMCEADDVYFYAMVNKNWGDVSLAAEELARLAKLLELNDRQRKGQP